MVGWRFERGGGHVGAGKGRGPGDGVVEAAANGGNGVVENEAGAVGGGAQA